MEPCGAFVFSAPEQLFELFRCYAWLIWFRQRTALLEPKRSCSRLALLTLRCRTEMFFQNIPVLRSAYFPKKLFSFFFKTLDLQVRFAHPPTPHRNAPSRHSGVTSGLLASLNARTPAAARPPMGGGSFAPPCTPLSCPRRTRTDGQAESALDWVGRETAHAAEGGAMRPRSGRRHGGAGRAVCLCGVRKGRIGGPEGVRGSRSAPGLPRRGSGGAASYGRPVKSVRRDGGE